MIELTLFEAGTWGIIIASVTSLVATPLAIRYLTPNKEN